jgi:hypothetical protein
MPKAQQSNGIPVMVKMRIFYGKRKRESLTWIIHLLNYPPRRGFDKPLVKNKGSLRVSLEQALRLIEGRVETCKSSKCLFCR